jgi:hypothetical protein
MDQELMRLNTWLMHRIPEYVAMVDVGSTAAGDALVNGRSDRDICLVFESEYDSALSLVRTALEEFELPAECLFATMTKAQFIGPQNSTHDFSHRFRSRTLYGDDLAPQVQLPSAEVTFRLYSTGLDKLTQDLSHRVDFCQLWPESKLRDSFYSLFKHAFMYLAIKHYHERGTYPMRRIDVAEAYGQPLPVVLEALCKIDRLVADEMFGVAKQLREYLSKLKHESR